MKKYITTIICVLVLCCAGPVFAEGRDHGRGHEGNYGNHHGSNHGYYQHSNHGYHPSGWGYGFYTPAITVVTPGYPVYYPPVVRCRYIDVYDAWGNFRGQERICD